MAQNQQEKMYKLGLAMEEFRKFFWMGICLFFFIIPPFILLWKYIQFLIALNDVRQTSPQNENLKYGFISLIIAFAIPFATTAVSINGFEISSSIFTILQFGCVIFGWMKLEQWGGDLYRERNTHNMTQVKEGFKEIMIAQILSIIIIGIFMIPGAFENVGTALIREFGPRRQTAQQPQYSQTQQPVYGQTQQPVYGQTQQPVYGQTQQPRTHSPERPSICPQCGVSVADKDIKFCGSCGYKF